MLSVFEQANLYIPTDKGIEQAERIIISGASDKVNNFLSELYKSPEDQSSTKPLMVRGKISSVVKTT